MFTLCFLFKYRKFRKTTTIYFSIENTQIFKQLNRQHDISYPLIQNKVVCT